ncbi:basic proline-rich protein-like [Canis lupus familiaris]|uniref:basic proline-rich protein-like n=1 Tax=Canis lupus familiaris TaxID=9615 RepID=UPI0018F2C06D|nr:basic proline-rich protein-like [Canis lupus familiaris]
MPGRKPAGKQCVTSYGSNDVTRNTIIYAKSQTPEGFQQREASTDLVNKNLPGVQGSDGGAANELGRRAGRVGSGRAHPAGRCSAVGGRPLGAPLRPVPARGPAPPGRPRSPQVAPRSPQVAPRSPRSHLEATLQPPGRPLQPPGRPRSPQVAPRSPSAAPRSPPAAPRSPPAATLQPPGRPLQSPGRPQVASRSPPAAPRLSPVAPRQHPAAPRSPPAATLQPPGRPPQPRGGRRRSLPPPRGLRRLHSRFRGVCHRREPDSSEPCSSRFPCKERKVDFSRKFPMKTCKFCKRHPAAPLPGALAGRAPSPPLPSPPRLRAPPGSASRWKLRAPTRGKSGPAGPGPPRPPAPPPPPDSGAGLPAVRLGPRPPPNVAIDTNWNGGGEPPSQNLKSEEEARGKLNASLFRPPELEQRIKAPCL